MTATSGWDQQRKVSKMLEDLWQRLETKFADLRDSYEGTIDAVESPSATMQLKAQKNTGRAREELNGKLAANKAKLVKMEGSPQISLTRQVEFVDD